MVEADWPVSGERSSFPSEVLMGAMEAKEVIYT